MIYNCEAPAVCCDGNIRTISWSATRLLDADSQPIGTIAIGRDLTEQKQLEREIIESLTDQQRHIGQELHDGVGGELTGIAFFVQMLIDDLHKQGRTETKTATKIGKALEFVVQTATNTRPGLQSTQCSRRTY